MKSTRNSCYLRRLLGSDKKQGLFYFKLLCTFSSNNVTINNFLEKELEALAEDEKKAKELAHKEMEEIKRKEFERQEEERKLKEEEARLAREAAAREAEKKRLEEVRKDANSGFNNFAKSTYSMFS